MRIAIHTHLKYEIPMPASLLLQIEAAADDTQVIEDSSLYVATPIDWNIISGEADIGQRRWGDIHGTFDCRYKATVCIKRPAVDLPSRPATPVRLLPAEVTPYLMPSRYCHPEAFLAFVPEEFGEAKGGDLIVQMAAWIETNFTYDNGASTPTTTATDSFHARAGVCRDYAHVLVTMARSVGIPARLASVYAPGVSPPDFHAVAEVYLSDDWHLVDPTGMAAATEMARIGVGRDAADVSFMTSYGQMNLLVQTVQVTAVT